MRRLIMILLALLLVAGASAEGTVLLHEENLTITLEGVHTEQGGASLTLRCINGTDRDKLVYLVMPGVNGAPAGFRWGWPTQCITLPAGGDVTTEIRLEPDDPGEWPETFSFRVVDENRVTSAAMISLTDGTVTEAASFAKGAEEPQLLLTDVAHPEEMAAHAVVLTDRITPEQEACLDFGQAQICLRRQTEEGELLVHFTTVEAVVSPEGDVTADYSGLALVRTEQPDFPMHVAERAHGAPALVGNLTLAGTYVFFTSLEFSLRIDGNTAVLCDSVLSGLDEVKTAQGVPLAMFETLYASHSVFGMAEEDGVYALTFGGVHDMEAPLTAPLSFSLVPVETLGEIVVYFEYFFEDGTDVIHAPFQLDKGLTVD